jgi:excisionase family DNA binding protein
VIAFLLLPTIRSQLQDSLIWFWTAEYLWIPPLTVYYLVQRGKIPAIHIGGRWRIKKSSLDRDILRQDKSQGQPTVLVVDDDPGLQDLFRTLSNIF